MIHRWTSGRGEGASLVIVALIALTLSFATRSNAAYARHTQADATGTPAIATPAATSTSAPSSWPGAPSLYLGRYRLKQSSNHKLARTGQLTMFLRTVKNGIPPVLSGILALFGPAGNNVFYLTNLGTSGTTLTADASVGSYSGPVIGTFEVIQWQAPRMVVRIHFRGRKVTTLHFVRFSKNPQP